MPSRHRSLEDRIQKLIKDKRTLLWLFWIAGFLIYGPICYWLSTYPTSSNVGILNAPIVLSIPILAFLSIVGLVCGMKTAIFNRNLSILVLGLMSATSLFVCLYSMQKGMEVYDVKVKNALREYLEVSNALEEYKSVNRQYPQTLTELVPVYLERVPLSPHKEAPISFTRLSENRYVFEFSFDGGSDCYQHYGSWTGKWQPGRWQDKK